MEAPTKEKGVQDERADLLVRQEQKKTYYNRIGADTVSNK